MTWQVGYLRTELDHGHAEQGAPGEVVPVLGLVLSQPDGLLLPPVRWQRGQVDQRQADLHLGDDHLHRRAVLDGEDGAQRLVPRHALVEGSL